MTTAIATFGRFNIAHLGHDRVLNQMQLLRNNIQNAEIIVGFSSNERANRKRFNRLTDYRTICNSANEYSTIFCNNLYTYCRLLSAEYDTAILCLGSDRIAATQRLLDSTNIVLLEVERSQDAPSSTALRELYRFSDTNFEIFATQSVNYGLLRDRESARIAYNAILEERLANAL